jgi:hypothetical protein
MTLRSFRSTAALVSRTAAAPAAARFRRFGVAGVLRFGVAGVLRFALESGRRRGFASGRARAVVLATEARRCRPKVRADARREPPPAAGTVAPTSAGATADCSLSFPETPYATAKPLSIRPMPSSEPPSRLNARL